MYFNNTKVESITYNVDSIKGFLESFDPEVDGREFAVCEKLNQKNWFYCENNH